MGWDKGKYQEIYEFPEKMCKTFESTELMTQERGRRPPKVKAGYRRKWVLGCQKNPFFTSREDSRSAGDMTDISIYTVKRILRKYGLQGRVAAKNSLLKRGHICKDGCEFMAQFYIFSEDYFWRQFF